MRIRTGTVYSAASLLLMLGMIILAGSSPVAAQGVCSDFDKKHTITKLGGPNALGPGGLQTRAELKDYFAKHNEEVVSILASQGLGKEVAHALLAAIREDSGITERDMAKGEQLEWMAYRSDGKVRTIPKVCLRLSGTAPAFEIAVEVVTATKAAKADCSIKVTTDCQPGGTSSFQVRTAPGAQVTLKGPAGTSTITKDGDSTWTGPIDDPYQADYTFTVTNQAETSETVTTYTFLVPRECVNLALVRQPEKRVADAPVTCSEDRALSKPVCPVPPPPTCAIDLDKTEVRRGESVSYKVTGTWAKLDLQLMHEGTPLAEPVLTSKSGTFVPGRRGTYTVIATATNELGDTHTCRASVEVVGADWIVRPFGALLIVDGETSGLVGTNYKNKNCPCPVSTTFGYDDGYGLGFNVERLFNERIGIEARVLHARLDDELWIGANGLGITDGDTRDYWDLSLGLNVHLTPNHKIDWYVGPYVGYSDLEGHKSFAVDQSLEHETDGSVTWGVQTGLDWPFGSSPWSLHVGARYTGYKADVIRRYTDSAGAVFEQPDSLDIDPITIEVGVAYHF
ncbi:MAG: porin family protein [bacterium]|nr:porin family protein [bacterium]